MPTPETETSRSIKAALEQWGREVERNQLETLQGLLKALDFVISEEENIRRWTRSNSNVFESSDGRSFPITRGLCDLMVEVAVRSSYERDISIDVSLVCNNVLYFLTAAHTLEKCGQENWYPVTLPDQDGAELFDETTPEQKWSFGDYAEARWKYAREFREWLVNFVEEYAAKVEVKEQTNAKSS